MLCFGARHALIFSGRNNCDEMSQNLESEACQNNNGRKSYSCQSNGDEAAKCWKFCELVFMTVFVIEPARVFRKTWTTTTTTATTATHNKSSNQRTALFSPFAEVLDEHILHAQRRGGWISGVCKGEQQDTAIQFVPCFQLVCGSAHHNRINNKRSGICPGFIPPIFFGFRFVPSDPLTTKVWKRRRDIERDKTVERKVNPVSNTAQDWHEHKHTHTQIHSLFLSCFPFDHHHHAIQQHQQQQPQHSRSSSLLPEYVVSSGRNDLQQQHHCYWQQ